MLPARPFRLSHWALLGGLLWVVSTAACSKEKVAVGLPTLENCGGGVALGADPQRVVAMNQSAAEVLIALGLGERIVATAWQDSESDPGLADAYARIPTRWRGYPSPVQFASVEPDLAYATFESAFNHDLARARSTLAPFGIQIYLSPWACQDPVPPAELTFDPIERELREVATIFGIEERGAMLAASLRQRLDAVRASSSARPGPPPSVVWYVSGVEQPVVGAGQGVLQLATQVAGARNPFEAGRGSYAQQSWSQLAAADPDWIGLVDQVQLSAVSKRALLSGRPETASLRSVREGRFFVVPFSHTLPGVRVADTAETLAATLDRGP
ncbi:MAG: ABC transporter substrate-binding protein [Planctomycetota bacterium]